MKNSSLESKTIRPGMASYSFYYSSRNPRTVQPKAPPKEHHSHPKRYAILVLIVIAAFIGLPKIMHASNTANVTPTKTTAALKKTTPAVTATTTDNKCQSNTLSKFIIVSISARHMWACQGSTTVYDSPVVTGIEYLAADRTPVGTYKIYGKQTDTVLTGSDSTGSWRDPVSYWMPWLNNQYGTYGFHDATWRDNSAFGTINPNSSDASHGCVELPLATAQWLYNWAPVGTTLTINA